MITHIRDDPMERTFGVSEPVLTRGELAEILRRARYHVIEQAKYNSAGRFRVDRHIELHPKSVGCHQTLIRRHAA